MTAPVITARDAGLVACTRCTRVWPLDTPACARCGSALRSRDATSLSRVWAWWVAGLLFYIPANLYPMLLTRTLSTTLESTIVGGAIDLIRHDAAGIAVVILVASIGIPIAKFLCIAYLALAVRHGTRVSAGSRQKMYEIVEYIGRWSMIDVFVVAILSSLVQLNMVAAINPGPASLAFACSVIFTMFSAQAFDPRMIWDRIEEDEGMAHPASNPATVGAATFGPSSAGPAT